MNNFKSFHLPFIAISIFFFLLSCGEGEAPSTMTPTGPSGLANVESIILAAEGINYEVDPNPIRQSGAFHFFLKIKTAIPAEITEVTVEEVKVSDKATTTLKVGDKKQISPQTVIDFTITSESGLQIKYTIEPEFSFKDFTVEDFEVEPTPTNPSKGFQTIIDFRPFYSTPDITEECFHSTQWGTYGYDGWGYWDNDNNNFDPRVVDANGRRDIRPGMYPQIDVYDVNDPVYQDYLALILKTAGIDIFSYRLDLRWVLAGRTGDRCKFSTASVDGYMRAMEEAGLPFMLTVNVRANFLQFGLETPTEAQALAALEEMADYIVQNFFGQPNYHHINGLPALRITSRVDEEFLDEFAQAFDGKAFYFVNEQDVFDAMSTPDKTNFELETGGLIGRLSYGGQLEGENRFQNVDDVKSVYREGDFMRNNLEWLAGTSGAEYITMEWNDYINSFNAVRLIEPSLELGSDQLTILAETLGTYYSEEVFKVCTDYYIKRKALSNDEFAQKQLDQIKQYLLSNQVDKAMELNAEIGN